MRTKILSLLLIAALFFTACRQKDVFEAPVEVSWTLLENMAGPDEACYKTEVRIKNMGDKDLDANWLIYYNQFPRTIVEDSLSPVKTENVYAGFYRMYPTKNYEPLAPGKEMAFTVLFRGSLLKETEAPQGMYFVPTDKDGHELAPQKMGPVNIIPFATGQKQWQRNKNDRFPYPSGQYVYGENIGFVLDQQLGRSDIFPSIKNINLSVKDSVKVLQSIKIVAPAELKNEASYLQNVLTGENGARVGDGGNFKIELLVDSAIDENREAYSIGIGEEGITVKGTSPRGVMWGVQTLRNMLNVSKLPVQLPSGEIFDEPDFEYRGFMFDIARNFRSKEAIKVLIEQMSRLKMNKFHLHFSDDEAWRLEIPGLEELTEYGSRRGHTLDEKEFMQPRYGSGFDPDDLNSNGNGYLTREDFIEILKYAAERHVDVIPEVETPGHARAAVLSMKYRYEKYKDTDMAAAEQYRLDDPADTSKYYSAQAFTDNVMCVGRESAYNFFDKVISEIAAMYKDAGVKLEAIQTGGDEVPRGAWLGSPICQKIMAEHNMQDAYDLRDYFTEKFVAILKKHNLPFYGWMEIASKRKQPNEKFLNRNFVAYCWDTVGAWGGIEVPYQLANAGFDVILCNAPNLYLDFAYNKHPQEPGLYWGGFVSEQDCYNFLPFDAYRSVKVGSMGKRLDWAKDAEGMTQLTEEGRKRIKGIQAELWAETLKTEAQVQYYIFPKLFAVAERAWNSSPEWSETADDAQRIAGYNIGMGKFLTKVAKREMPALDAAGINFRIAPAGIEFNEENKLVFHTTVPGATVRYTLDGREPDEKSSVWTGKPVETNSKNIKAQVFYMGKKSHVTEYFTEDKLGAALNL